MVANNTPIAGPLQGLNRASDRTRGSTSRNTAEASVPRAAALDRLLYAPLEETAYIDLTRSHVHLSRPARRDCGPQLWHGARRPLARRAGADRHLSHRQLGAWRIQPPLQRRRYRGDPRKRAVTVGSRPNARRRGERIRRACGKAVDLLE